jgi:cytochrome b
MNTASASRAERSPAIPASRRVVDAPTRVVHWLLALSFIGAYLSGDSERWRLLHVSLGYTILGLVIHRVLWGLIGPRHTRLSAWAAKLRGTPDFLRSLRSGKPNPSAAQNLLNTLFAILILGFALIASISGYAVYEELGGDWLEELHELSSDGMLVMVLGHLLLIVTSSLLRRQNLAARMFSGRLPGRGPDLIKRNHGALAALILAVVLGFWFVQLLAPA